MSILQSQAIPLIVLGFAALVILGVLLGIALDRPRGGRAALVGGGLPLVLLLPTLASGLASWGLIRAFGKAAEAGSAAPMLAFHRDLWSLQRTAWAGVAALSLLALALILLGRAGSPEPPSWSGGRAVVVALLPILAFTATASLARVFYRGIRITYAVMTPRPDDVAGQKAIDAVLAAEGLGGPAPGAIHAISDRITRLMMGGVFGSLAGVFALSGVAALGFGLAWRARPGPSLVTAFSALWALAAIGAILVSAGVFDPFRGLAA